MGSEGFLGIGAEKSPIEKVLGISFQIGELVANIGEGIGKIAKLQIPIDWDPKTGKVTNYRTLKKKDFDDMGDGISTILTSIFTALIDKVYKGNEKLFKDISTGFLSKDKPSPITSVLTACTTITQIIGNLGQGISKIATLQIPIDWDPKTGHATNYIKLEKNDLVEAGSVVGDIVSCVVESLQQAYKKNEILQNDTKFKKVIESVQPISELISNMAEGIVHLASGQIPDKWDPKTGKPTHYKEILPQDYINAGETIGQITTSIAESLITTVNAHPEYFFKVEGTGENKTAIYNESNDAFQTVVQSFTGLTGMTDAIIKLGQGLVPDKWDDNGTPIHYKSINFDEIIPHMQDIITKILTSITDTTITVYNLHKDDAFAPDSTFNEAVNSMNSTVGMMSKMAETVINIGSSMIPDKWDDKGKPIHFSKINVDEAVTKANEIFSKIMGGIYY